MALSAPSASSAPERPRRGGRLGYAVIGVLAAVMAVGWAVIVANVGQTPGIAAQTVAWSVVDDSSVRIRYQVAKPKDAEVRCVVDAFDTDFAVVAYKEITVPRGTSGITRNDVLRTSRRATGARIKDCRKI
ncbi:hypothetical protein Arub01_03610 [Actinomadura rubrobrunea]|uniref:DUF4307 domain-containing protein n=1 Tax=Actinomadura rubrobrunea TaxID=115335 RepID=A0A9W6UUC4_9ACTN|nr:DUF4307 domain-containing protein [Actinomadura rubrobrunea]GLW62117.1 hypothetical protein Arub01_03610 [Actinomadura rubrobrunea]